MDKAFKINRENTMDSLEFINSFGVIFKEDVIIPRYSHSPINLKYIKRLELRKRRKYHKNLLGFVLAAYAILPPLYYADDPWYWGVSLVMSLVIFIIGLFIREYEYKFLMVKEYDFTELIVEKGEKDDAKKIVSKINKKIHKRRELAVA